MKIAPIRNEKDYQKALVQLEKVFDAKKGTEQGDTLEILSILIDKYEKENYPIEMPDPIEAIKFRMEQMGMQSDDLIGVIGGKNKVVEILNKKKKLTVEMIRELERILNISASVLVNNYQLSNE